MSVGGTESAARPGRDTDRRLLPNGDGPQGSHCYFQMPLHYPRFTRADYEAMPDWKLDLLLREYGLSFAGDLHQKRKFAAGAFLWPHEC